MSVLIPADLDLAEGGVPYSNRYGDVYHSTAGGPGQARHVFLAGNRLPQRWHRRDRFTILETGFGTGLNFLATWDAWRHDLHACQRLEYIAVEKHPFQVGDLAAIHSAWPDLAGIASQLRTAWPTLVPGFHRLELADGGICLTLLFGDAMTVLGKLRARVDAFYLDGFAPSCNPELWTPQLFRQLARLALPEATLATWSVSGMVREGLAKADFTTEKVTGFGHKKSMLRGQFQPRRPLAQVPALGHERRAIVIGAGLAGATCCERLASRGWEVTLIDQHRQPAQAASGNPAGIVMPMLSLDDNLASRLSRAALLHALHHWQGLPEENTLRYSGCGVMQISRVAGQAETQQEAVARLGFPADFVRFLDPRAAAEQIGQPLSAGGWFFPQCGWARPVAICDAHLALAGVRLRGLYGREAQRLSRVEGNWQVTDANGEILGTAPVVVVASGHEAGKLLPSPGVPIQAIRGQISFLTAGTVPAIRSVLCGDGYITPAFEGQHCVGASYDLDDDPRLRLDSHQGNLQRLRLLLPGAAIQTEPTIAGRVAFRAVAPDRLPMVGALPSWPPPGLKPGVIPTQLNQLPRHEGLYCLLGYGSRGLTWANLMADILVATLEGNSMPVETDLLDAVDPGRFLLRKLRHGLMG